MAEPEEVPYESLFSPVDRASQQNAFDRTSDVAHTSQAGNAAKDGSLGKQPSLLHQSSSYLKQATSGFMRWQSRRAFWSAVDQAGDQGQGVTVACKANARSVLAFWFKTVWVMSRRHPTVLIAPLLLAAACIAGGVAGVVVAAHNAEQRARDDTAILALQASSSLELLVETQALQPSAAAASLVRLRPAMATLGDALPALLQRLLPPSTDTPVRQLVMAPFGRVNVSYSPAAAAAPGAAPSVGVGSIFAVGDSAWAVGSVAAAATTLAAQTRLPVVATMATTSPTANGFKEMLLLAYHPVYVAGVSADETWGNVMPADFEDSVCGQAGCYDESSRTMLWGFVISVVSLSALSTSPEAGLQSLSDGSYTFRLAVLPSGKTEWVSLAVSSPPPHVRRGSVVVPVRLAGPRAGAAATEAATEAELLVDHDNGWQVAWEGPLIAVVVVVSLALSGFLFAVLFNYWRHTSMMQAMLPKKVVGVLDTGSNYYQHFDCVTVLYADVVRYTTAKPHEGDTVPTLEVVKLLNDVHSMYESIIEKYGLVRIRRSGESFLCLGGCPTPDEPVAVAVRVAACARDLVLATSRFRGAGGFRVQIRVGLHSGPAVAAVVGSKMPRFSLFGDIVDVAYYMEATSRVMAVHVSDVTSQLLTAANDPLLPLTPRGRLDIIGQGSMNTSWLRLDQLPDPRVAGEEAGEDVAAEVGTAAAAGAAVAVAPGGQPAREGCQDLELVGLIGARRVSSSGGVTGRRGGSGGGAGGGVA